LPGAGFAESARHGHFVGKESTMLKHTVWIVALLLGWAATGALGGDLSVGDPAPKLAVKEFVKGDPIAGIDKGKTYVVEFWATWCGPCRTTIPHLTELQKRYKDVTCIGVSIDQNAKAVKPFVEEMGDKMAYHVALDESQGSGRSMAKTWMAAAGQGGIPTAFIVNTDGKIAWIGHPMAMDKPLAEIAAGKWDLAAASARFKREQVRDRKLGELSPKLADASRSGDSRKVLKVIDEAIADDPDLEEMLANRKFQILLETGSDREKAREYAKKLVDSVLKDNLNGLYGLAWSIVGPAPASKPEPKLVQVALAAAQRAEELSEGKNAMVTDTLAKAYALSGDRAKARESEEKAMRLAKGTPAEMVLVYRKFQAQAGKGGDPNKAEEYAKQLVDTYLKDNPNGLNQVAWTIVGSEDTKPDAKLVKVALAAAQQADQLTGGKNAQVAESLARAYFLSGERAKALECQERAVRLAKGTRLENDKDMQKRLAEYKNAPEKASGGQR
jgi:thiol-disulfide isomerase/thioredoxin/tetratricopeptide (TPR) repeat protein